MHQWHLLHVEGALQTIDGVECYVGTYYGDPDRIQKVKCRV
jgi:hypothetical protein